MATFRYFHTGRLFRVESHLPSGGQEAENGNTTTKPLRRLEFFWLCDNCSRKMTLAYEKGGGISIRPKMAQSATAA
jgi:hypothetical protein